MKARLSGLLRKLAPAASPWRPADAQYPALLDLDLRVLAGHAGIYALWHLGVRPRWLRVSGAADLGAALARVRQVPDLRAAEAHGGVYVAWALLPPASIPAALGSLCSVLAPQLQTDIAGEIKPTQAAAGFPLPPGSQVPGGGRG